MLGVGCAIIGSEMTASFNDNGQTEEWIKIMYIICDCSSFILSKIKLKDSCIILVVNIVCSKLLYISWMKFKLLFTELDNIFNTGVFKWMIFEILCMAI